MKEFLQQRPGSQNIGKLSLIKEYQILMLRNLVLFYIWEEARVLAHWNHSFDMHLSYLEPTS